MANDNISGFLAQQVNAEVPKIESELAQLQSHVSFLIADKYIDARDRSRIQDEVMKHAMQLKHRIGAVMNMSKSVTRRSLGDRYGTFRGNVRAGLSRLDRKLDDLDDSIDILREKNHAEMNDPRRTSGDGISGVIDTVPEWISVLNDLGQFLGLLRLKRKKRK